MVLKFGGTSVADAAKIKNAARRAIAEKSNGHDVAVVVSARGKTTDELIALAREVHPDPPVRELDMLLATGEQESIALLAMAIQAQGVEAVSLTGGQMGIVTDATHGKARIQTISTERIERVFAQGAVAIVAGFQGTDPEQNITTLGRGGSDTTAVAIAAALHADLCEIFTDVTGVYTTDPRLVPEARKIEQVSYDEMLELASVGAGVMHSRSIEFAKKFGVVIHVRHAGKEEAGTVIRPADPVMEHVVVRGAALTRDEVRVTLRGVPDSPGVVHQVFARLAAANIVVDMIVQDIALGGRTEVSFTVPEDDLARALPLAEQAARDVGAARVDHDRHVGKVSVVGLGMRTHAGVAERMFRALAGRGINIILITTSEIKISVLVERSRALEALEAVHREFGLDERLPEYTEDPRFRLRAGAAEGFPRPFKESAERLRSIARSLPRMEDILVSDVELDDGQGRVTLYGLPDTPGVAARVFERVAAGNVAVDMIVQNVGEDGTTHLSFTVPRDDLDAAERQVRSVTAELGVGSVAADPATAKLSVRGVGMRSHRDVATTLFRTLAARQVNVQAINTSELHITVLVERRAGPPAAAALRRAFGLEE